MTILLDPNARPVIGHRGNAAHAPENTLESFAQAIALGADAIEFDVRITADGQVVVHHDPTVERTTGAAGDVDAMNLAELRALDAGATFTRDGASFPYRERGVRIPTLDEVLESFRDLPLLIEIKTAAASERVRHTIERHGAGARCVLDAFDDHALTVFHDSGMPLGAARGDVAALLLPAIARVPWRRGRYAVVCTPLTYCGLPLPVAGFVRSLRPSGRVVHVWTINDAEVGRRLWRLGVRGIITDDPATMLRARAGMPVG